MSKLIRKLDHLLSRLQQRIYTHTGHEVALRYCAGSSETRAALVASTREDWTPVTRDLVWGEPDGYYWFGGSITLADELIGQRLAVHVEAAFGSVMGRSDPQCLVRVNGRIVQGVDGNHREFPLTEEARPGEAFDILIEAGTIEDRRQLGFACHLVRHDLDVEETYYDLRVPLDVARLLAEDDPRRSLSCVSSMRRWMPLICAPATTPGSMLRWPLPVIMRVKFMRLRISSKSPSSPLPATPISTWPGCGGCARRGRRWPAPWPPR
ncbi:hypothetical protein V6L77_09395 [Pannonibacter sp. Pt2-lr]